MAGLRRGPIEQYYRKAHRRLGKQDSATIMAWAENSVWAVQAAFEGYRAQRDEAALDEALRGIAGLQACADILLDRERSGQSH
jgi:hypothetical protein